MLSRVATLLSLALLTSCGFQLQGAYQTPEAMQRTYIEAPDRHSLFYLELRQQLQAAGVELVDTADAATATLSIMLDNTDQRVLSVSARNVPTEYDVFYTIQYALSKPTESLLSPTVLTLTRDYTYDSTLVLGKAREEQMLREAIVADLVRIVMKQLATL